LEEIGVSRLSFGPRPMRAMLALLVKMKKELLESGTYKTMFEDTISYDEINSLLRKK
jgi:2-methylisocitrate lyase-like PEP mutase family enzyme